tara:strand:+ start:1772 stop:2176 length:405 start_codon:yes stop_codon:yes gene_type:complete
MLKQQLIDRITLLEESIRERRKDFDEVEEQRNTALDGCDNLSSLLTLAEQDRDSANALLVKVKLDRDDTNHKREAALRHADATDHRLVDAARYNSVLDERIKITHHMLITLGHSHSEAREAVGYIGSFLTGGEV